MLPEQQLLFYDYELYWPIQMIPEHWKIRSGNRKRRTKPIEPCVYPVEPYRPLLTVFVRRGQFRYPRGHSRARIDNPTKSDSNQSSWLLLRQLPRLGLTQDEFNRYLVALLSYGFVEQRLSYHGHRFRISWYGHRWLKAQR